VAIALFTFAVSAVSSVNSPVLRLVSLEAQALRITTAIAARTAFRRLCLVSLMSVRHRLVVAELQRIERPLRRLRFLLLLRGH
jgi:hypothetical protein